MNAAPQEQFRAAIAAAGLTPPDDIEADGEFHRFPTNGNRGDDSGWYVLYNDGVPAGAFGDWRTGASEKWCANIGRRLAPAEALAQSQRIEEARRKRDAEEARLQAEARQRAAVRWEQSKPADPSHPYLVAKGVRPHGIRQEGELLLVPMRDGNDLHSLQTISPAGEKRFMAGGRVAGCYLSIGKPGDTVLVCEGYATGATLYEATGYPVAVAFNVGNLLAVARGLRERMPDARIIVCADDDRRTQGNVGLTKANEAAREIGGLVATPIFLEDRRDGDTDFNDLARYGIAAVKRAVANPQAPEVPEPHPVAENAIAADSGLPDVTLIRGDSVTPRAIRWLWYGWLAAGKFHVLGGQPGTGKTTIALDFAAIVSSGRQWPDGTRAEAGNVLIWSGEDDPADVLAPRLQAMGADMSKIYFVGAVRRGMDDSAFDPATDLPALESKAESIGGARLLIVDPVVSAVAGDSHKNAETRRSLQPLVNLAQRLDCAVLGITHFSKGTGGREPIERITGSLAFGALARVVMVTFKQPEDRPEGGPARMLVRAKSNISPDDGGFGYDLIHEDLAGFPGIGASRVEWGAPVDGTARELLAKAEDVDEDGSGENARDFLRSLLSCGPMPTSEVFRDGEAHGYSKRQMQRARSAIGASIDKSGFKAGWVWSLPKMPPGPEDAEDTEQNEVAPSAPSADFGHRWRITRPNGEAFTTTTVQLMAAAEMAGQYPSCEVEQLDVGHC